MRFGKVSGKSSLMHVQGVSEILHFPLYLHAVRRTCQAFVLSWSFATVFFPVCNTRWEHQESPGAVAHLHSGLLVKQSTKESGCNHRCNPIKRDCLLSSKLREAFGSSLAASEAISDPFETHIRTFYSRAGLLEFARTPAKTARRTFLSHHRG